MDFRQFVHNMTLGIALFSMLILPLSALGFINYSPDLERSQVLSAESDASREVLPKYIIVRESTESTQASSAETR